MSRMIMALRFAEPAVSRKSLLKGAGIFWLSGGVMLLFRAFETMQTIEITQIWLVVVGAGIGWFKYRFAFSKVAAKNIRRIRELKPFKEKICLFAFQSLQAYLLVIAMISLGIALRMVGLPAQLLVVMYVAIGMALILSSSFYFRTASQL